MPFNSPANGLQMSECCSCSQPRPGIEPCRPSQNTNALMWGRCASPIFCHTCFDAVQKTSCFAAAIPIHMRFEAQCSSFTPAKFAGSLLSLAAVKHMFAMSYDEKALRHQIWSSCKLNLCSLLRSLIRSLAASRKNQNTT